MSESLLSVGLDVGTTSTQMVVSRLTIENRGNGFSVPEAVIRDRKILYRSPIHFTPLLDEHRMDAAALRRLVEREYQAAGITRQQVDTGAILITGETSRKENARAVLEALSDLAGEFVVTAAGPELESVLAAKGAGAVADSEKTGETVLHMDIGGGTSNLCLIRAGKIVDTGCLNIGGRLVKVVDGRIGYVSPALRGLFPLKPGDMADRGALETLARTLAQALEMAAGLRPATALLEQLATAEVGRLWTPPKGPVKLSFSGGVADCILPAEVLPDFGDIGPLLGKAMAESALCRGPYRLGRETIRATVVGAGCHSTQLSGSTVFSRNLAFPLKNLPVAEPGEEISREGPVIRAVAVPRSPGYAQVAALAEKLAAAHGAEPMLLCMESDAAKALGQALALRLPPGSPILCIDRVKTPPGSYLDIAAPVAGAFPLVVKTLVIGETP